MPKVTLEFNLPEEQTEFDDARKGTRTSIILFDMDNYLRSKLKYSELTEEQAEIYQEVRDMLTSLINEDE